jgi:hypothetical protein
MCRSRHASLLTDRICVSRVTTIDGYTVLVANESAHRHNPARITLSRGEYTYRLSDIEVGAVVVHVVVVVDEALLSNIPLGRQPGARCARGGRVKRARRLPTLDAQWLIGGEVTLACDFESFDGRSRVSQSALCLEQEHG